MKWPKYGETQKYGGLEKQKFKERFEAEAEKKRRPGKCPLYKGAHKGRAHGPVPLPLVARGPI